MKATVIHEYRAPEVLRYQDVADPVAGPGDVVAEVHAVSVNRVLDVVVRRGGQSQRGITLALIPGVDPSGVVAAIGDGVTGVALGERVAVLSHAVRRVRRAYYAPFTTGMGLIALADGAC